MVKKVNFKTSSKADDFNLDSFLNDSSSFDLTLDFGDSDKSSKNSKYKSIKKGVIDGVKSTAKSPSFYKTVIKSVMPREYGDALVGVKDISSTLSSLYSDSVREVKPGFQQIVRQIDKMVPDEQKSLKKFTEKMKKLTGSDLDSQSTMQSPEQLREQGIGTALTEIFGLQAEQGARQRANDKAHNLIKEQVDLKRFNISAQLLSGINTGITRLNAYNDRINQSYQRKSLEIQMRSLFIQTDMLALSKTSIETIARQNNEIIRLSSLTEQEKTLASEKFKKGKVGLFGGMTGGLLSPKSYLNSVSNRIKTAGSTKIQSVKSALESGLFGLHQVNDAKDMMEGMDKLEMISSMMTGQGLEYLAGKAGARFKDKILPAGSKRDNKLGGLLASIRDPAYISKQLSNSKYLKENSEDGSVKGGVKGFLRNLLGFLEPEAIENRLKKPGINARDLNDPAQFTNKTQQSITEIIPGYLARILRELQITRTGNPNTELTIYNPIKNEFLSKSMSARATATHIQKKLSNYGYSSSEDALLNEYTNGTNISENAKNVLRKRLKDHAFNPKESMHAHSVLSDDFISKQKLDIQKDLRIIQGKYQASNLNSGRNLNRAHQVGDRLRSAAGSSDERSLIESLAYDKGLFKELKKAGIISGSAEDPRINMERYKEYATKQTSYNEKARIQFYKDRNLYEPAIKAGIIKVIDGVDTINRKKDDDFIAGRIRLTPTVASDYNLKEGIQKQDGKSILDGIKKTRVGKWYYKNKEKYGSEQHTGPMAQDVRKNLGEEYAPGGKSIDLISLNGASMAAIGHLGNQVDNIKKKINNPSGSSESQKTVPGKKSLLEQIADNTRMTYEAISSKSYGFNIPISGLDIDGIRELIHSGKLKIDDLYGSAKQSSRSGFDRMRNFFNRTFKMAKEGAGFALPRAYSAAKWAFNKGKHFIDHTLVPQVKAGTKKLISGIGGAFDFASTGIKNMINPVVDVYSAANLKTPLLEARKILEGFYINQDTGKAIYTLGDITGPVIDTRGNVVVGLKDLESGLVNKEGKPIQNTTQRLKTLGHKLLSAAHKLIFNKLPTGIKQVAQGLSIGVSFVKNLINTPKDIYVKGNMTTPVMYAKDFYSEKYLDLKTKKVIRTLGDIKGPVVDKAGNYIVTEEDIQKGLVDVNGHPIVNLRQLVTGLALSGLGSLKNIASGAINKVAGFLKNKKLPGFGFKGIGEFTTYGKKTVDILTEIRDILKNQFGDSSHETNPAQGMLFPEEDSEEGTLPVGSSSAVAGGSFSTIKRAGQFIKNKATLLRNTGIGGRSRGFLNKLGSVGRSALKFIPGASKFGLSKVGSLIGLAGSSIGSGLSSMLGTGSSSAEGASKESLSEAKEQETHADLATETAEHNTVKQSKSLRRHASDMYNNVREHLLGSRQKGTNMSEVNAREKELEEKRRAGEKVHSKASLNPKYMNSSGMMSGILDKLKGFKSMISSAFSFISNIPGVSKITGLLNKIPGVGRVLGWGSKILGLGSAAEGVGAASGVVEAAAGAAGAAEAGAAAVGGSGLLATAGGAIASGAVAVGSTLLSAAASIIGVATSPFTLAALAVGGTLYAGYKYGQKNNLNAVDRFRMAQYGLTENDKSLYSTIMSLENYYDSFTMAGDNGSPTFHKEGINLKKILDIFSVDPSNELMVKSVSIYLAKRFNPVYLRTVSALWKINPKLRIGDIHRLSPKEIPDFLKTVQFSNGPYQELVSPFLNIPKLKATTDVVKDAYGKALTFVIKQKSGKDKCIAMRALGFVGDAISGTWEMLKDGVKGAVGAVWSGLKSIGSGIKNLAVGSVMGVVHGAEHAWSEAKALGGEGLKLLAACGIGSGPSKKALPDTQNKEKIENASKAKSIAQKEIQTHIKANASVQSKLGNPLLSTATSILTSPVFLPGFLMATAFTLYKKYSVNTKVTPIGQYRMTQYGLTPEQAKYNHYLLNLESYYDSIVKLDVKGFPKLSEKSLDFKKIAEIFDIDPNNASAVQHLTIYLYKRFNPVYLHNIAALWNVDPKLKLGDIEKLSAIQTDQYLKKAEYASGPYDIYVSPFTDLPKLTANSNWVKFEYDKAKDFVKLKSSSVTGSNASLSGPKSLKDKLVNAFVNEKKMIEKSVIPSVKNTLGNFASYIKQKAPTLYNVGTGFINKVGTAFKAGGKAIEGGENYILKNIKAAKGVFAKVKKLYDIYGVGALSAFFESSGNPATVSSGAGDNGGVSYGTFQLSSRTGGIQAFLKHYQDTPQVKKLLASGPINSEPFKEMWKQLGNTDMAFAKMQADYNKIQYLDPALNKLKGHGIDLSGKGPGVMNVIDATSDQFGSSGAVNVVAAALKGKDLTKMNDADIITAIEDYKIKTVGSHFRSSSAGVQASVARRFATEKDVAIKLTGQKTTVAGASKEIPAAKIVASSSPKAPIVASAVKPGATTTEHPTAPQTASASRTATTMPVSYQYKSAPVRSPEQSDIGQSLDMSKMHGTIGNVSKTLTQSLTVQQKMLESLLQIAANTGLLKSLSQQATAKPANVKTLPPSPSISLART